MNLPRVHLICNAHLDPVWQWRWEEGCAEALATFRTAVEILGEHPGLVFNHNEAVLYRWVERYDPPLFAEIQRLVRLGRWSISGGWYLQPDVNLPGIESLVRHVVEGRRYFRDRFGVRPLVAYNFDSFGHSAGLPQLLRLGGYRMYVHMRPQPSELDLPSDLYRWRGVDGSEVLALRIVVGLYHTERDNISRRLQEGADLALHLTRDVPVFWGLGDHGGGATREDLRRIDEFIRREDRVEIIHSTPDRLYEALRDAGESAPVVTGELQRVFTGCYTSLSRLKRRARISLGTLVQTEALCAAAWWLAGADYPATELDEAWRDHLFNDFHDILPGSCTEPAETDALDLYGRVSEAARRVRLGAAVALNAAPPRASVPVVVVNSNPAAGPVPVEFECMADCRPLWTGTWHLRLFDAGGREVECQEEQPEALLPFNGWRRKLSFLARLPAVGSAGFRVEVAEGAPTPRAAPPMVAHELDRSLGLVTRLDVVGRQCLAGPLLQPLAVEDDGDSWGTDRGSYRRVLGRFEARPGGVCTVRQGPVRTITESVLAWGQSRIVVHTIAYAGWPVLEYRLWVHWNEERKRLKLAVPTALVSASLEGEVPGGVVTRPADGQEHVHGRWFLLRGELDGRPAAVGVVNSGQHGLDFWGGQVGLSVLRSAAYCHEQGFRLGDAPARKYMDQGVHEIRLLVTAGEPDEVRARLPGLADWLDAPPAAYAHLPPARLAAGRGECGGDRRTDRDLLSLAPPGVRLLACKRSADGTALVVRLHEATGRPTQATLRLWPSGPETTLSLRSFEIKTLRAQRVGGWREVDPIDELEGERS